MGMGRGSVGSASVLHCHGEIDEEQLPRIP